MHHIIPDKIEIEEEGLGLENSVVITEKTEL